MVFQLQAPLVYQTLQLGISHHWGGTESQGGAAQDTRSAWGNSTTLTHFPPASSSPQHEQLLLPRAGKAQGEQNTHLGVLLVVVVVAAVEVTAPRAPLVLRGFRFKGKPEAEVVPAGGDSGPATREDTPGTSQTESSSRLPCPRLQELQQIPLKGPAANPSSAKGE